MAPFIVRVEGECNSFCHLGKKNENILHHTYCVFHSIAVNLISPVVVYGRTGCSVNNVGPVAYKLLISQPFCL